MQNHLCIWLGLINLLLRKRGTCLLFQDQTLLHITSNPPNNTGCYYPQLQRRKLKDLQNRAYKWLSQNAQPPFGMQSSGPFCYLSDVPLNQFFKAGNFIICELYIELLHARYNSTALKFLLLLNATFKTQDNHFTLGKV